MSNFPSAVFEHDNILLSVRQPARLNHLAAEKHLHRPAGRAGVREQRRKNVSSSVMKSLKTLFE